MREETGDTGLGGKLDTGRQGRTLRHAAEIFLHGYIIAEVEHVFQIIAIKVPHTVEITGGEPLGIKYFFRLRASDGIQ